MVEKSRSSQPASQVHKIHFMSPFNITPLFNLKTVLICIKKNDQLKWLKQEGYEGVWNDALTITSSLKILRPWKINSSQWKTKNVEKIHANNIYLIFNFQSR